MSSFSLNELLVFELGGHRFSVPLASIEEVVPSTPITAVPNSPKFFLGLSAVRGRVLGVIDAASRYGLPPAKNAFFMVCHVRGNTTAITVDRPLVAGSVNVRELSADEIENLRSKTKLDKKFLKGGFEIFEKIDEKAPLTATGILCLHVDPDLFVSAEMASRVGEAA